MLKIVFSNMFEDLRCKNMIRVPDGKFRDNYKSDWICNDLFRRVVSDVDDSDVVSDGVLYQREYGVHYSLDRLASGTKMLMLMYYLKKPYVYDLAWCGDNCAKWLMEIGKVKDVIAFLQDYMPIEPTEDNPVMCINNGEIMKSVEDFRRNVPMVFEVYEGVSMDEWLKEYYGVN